MSKPILSVRNLKMHFPIRSGLLQRISNYVKAVDGVSFDLYPGETLGLVGESGCGKTTLARTVIRLLEPTAGQILYRPEQNIQEAVENISQDAIDPEEGLVDLARLRQATIRPLRKEIQYIFQDPYSSLNARMSIERVLTEPLAVAGVGSPRERKNRAAELLERVGLNKEMLQRYPNEFSGGQRQRIVVARALMLEPRLIICDEPVSALDVSVQAQVLNLLKELQQDFNFTYLFIAHDLSVVDYVSDRIMVMYLGRIVETGTPDEIYSRPKHPYTEALMASIPTPDPRAKKRETPPRGGVPSPANPPPGCHFHPRCPYAIDQCREVDPVLESLTDEGRRAAACIRKTEMELRGYEDLRVREGPGSEPPGSDLRTQPAR